jgi:hypothetical protein
MRYFFPNEDANRAAMVLTRRQPALTTSRRLPVEREQI